MNHEAWKLGEGRVARDLSKIMVVDVESTCWDGGIPPPGQNSEIIQVGISCLNIRKGRLGDVDRLKTIYVRPEMSAVSPFCEQLTGVTQAKLNAEGLTFRQMCERIHDTINPERFAWASWGDYDRVMFQQGCVSYGAQYPWSKTHINIKNLFAFKYRLDKEVGKIEDAMALHLWPFQGRSHDAADDAYNAGGILAVILF